MTSKRLRAIAYEVLDQNLSKSVEMDNFRDISGSSKVQQAIIKRHCRASHNIISIPIHESQIRPDLSGGCEKFCSYHRSYLIDSKIFTVSFAVSLYCLLLATTRSSNLEGLIPFNSVHQTWLRLIIFVSRLKWSTYIELTRAKKKQTVG